MSIKQHIDKTSIQSATISNLRFPMIVAVVLIHALGSLEVVAPHYDSSFSGIDLYNLIRITFSIVLPSIAVPIFFIISGFLYFNNIKDWSIRVYIKKTQRRFHSLVLPYVLWNVIALLIPLGIVIKRSLSQHAFTPDFLLDSMQGLRWLWNIYISDLDHPNLLGEPTYLSSPINYPLWFLRDLICMSALSPIVYYWVRLTRIYGIILLGICYITNILPFISGLKIDAIFFFTLGAWFSIQTKGLLTSLLPHQHSLAIGSVLLGIASIYCYGKLAYPIGFVQPLFTITAALYAFVAIAKMIEKGYTTKPLLKHSCFFIYATHTLLILDLSTMLTERLFFQNNSVCYLLRYLTCPLLTISICILIYYCSARLFPRLTRLLTGNR